MAKTFNCKLCAARGDLNVPFEYVSFDKEDNYGDFRRCNLCGDITPMKRRLSEKKRARASLIERLISEYDTAEFA